MKKSIRTSTITLISSFLISTQCFPGSVHLTFSSSTDYRVGVTWSGLEWNQGISRLIVQDIVGKSARPFSGGYGLPKTYESCDAFCTKKSGSFSQTKVGPGYIGQLKVYASWWTNLSKTTKTIYLSVSTLPILKPTAVHATQVSDHYYDRIRIWWEKGSDIPDEYLKYIISRDGIPIATVSGDKREYWDMNVCQHATHTYTVRTRTDEWGGHTSNGRNAVGRTDGPPTFSGLEAADQAQDRNILLKWPEYFPPDYHNVSITNYMIERISSKDTYDIMISADQNNEYNYYDSYEIIPGRIYTYRVTPISSDPSNYIINSDQDFGNMIPNGMISGRVKSRSGMAGVDSIRISVEGMVNGTPLSYYTYSTTAGEAEGDFQIEYIYYDDSAVFTVTPEKPGHYFVDPYETVTLENDFSNPNAYQKTGIIFYDTTTLAVSGTITYNGCDCPAKNITVFLDDSLAITRTDENGHFALAIEDIGVHRITSTLHSHTFDPPYYQLVVDDDLNNLDFADLTMDTVKVRFMGGCSNTIADSASFEAYNADDPSCYSYFFTVDTSRETLLVLPAMELKFKLSEVYGSSNDMEIKDFLVESKYFDNTNRDTCLIPVVEFTYHSPLELELVSHPPYVCLGEDSMMIFMQNLTYNMLYEFSETYTYRETTDLCNLNRGRLVILNAIGTHVSQDPIEVNEYGFAPYRFVAGEPNIASGGEHPFQRLLQVKGVTTGTQEESLRETTREDWILLTGHRVRTSTFTTKTPQIPLMILHDPPGDRSYSWFRENQSYSYTYKCQIERGWGLNEYLDLKFGGGAEIPWLGATGVFGHLEVDAVQDWDSITANAATFTFSVENRVSTSDEDNFMGDEGDIIIGSSFNMIYALTDVVDYDPATCSVVRDTALSWKAGNESTIYQYSVKYVENNLIPELKTVRNLSPRDSMYIYQSYIDLWEDVLEKNRQNKSMALPDPAQQPLSISAGSSKDYEYTSDTTYSDFFEFTQFYDEEVALALGWKAGEFNQSEAGAAVRFRWHKLESTATEASTSKSFGYHLEDNDPNDAFYMDIKKDRVYGTPVFNLISAKSSCPYEDHTQHIDELELTLGSYEASGIPAAKPAVFDLYLSNLSESDHARIYEIRSVASQNPDGAVLSISGQNLAKALTLQEIDAGTTVKLTLEVNRGPQAYDYNDLMVIAYPPCEYALYEADGGLAVADTVIFSVHFESECTPVEIYSPSDGWRISGSTGNSIPVVLTGYDRSNENLINLGIQLREGKSAWKTVTDNIIPGMLASDYYQYNLDFSGMPDGNYEIQAYAYCGLNGGKDYSQAVQGKVSREGAALLGNPEPADGYYNAGDEISVAFTGDIDCNFHSVFPASLSLTVNDTLSLPAVVLCQDNMLTIETVPKEKLEEYDRSIVRVVLDGIRDMEGNDISGPIEWSFEVNTHKVFWSPPMVLATFSEGEPLDLSSSLVNRTVMDHAFSLTPPAGITAIPGSGSIPADGKVDISFTGPDDLPLGTYLDTVVALIDGTTDENLILGYYVIRGWPIDTAGSEYQMTLYLQFCHDFNDVDLSRDVNDVIGVFVGDECRGMANIRYMESCGDFLAVMQVKSTQERGEKLSFKIYDASGGVMASAVETLTFFNGIEIGNPENPLILHVIPVGITDHSAGEFHLAQNYPNPAADHTIIEFSLQSTEMIDLAIYNQFGQRIRQLEYGQRSPGRHLHTVDVSDLEPGLYFYRLCAGKSCETRRMVVIR